jgi:hypothetical protein
MRMAAFLDHASQLPAKNLKFLQLQFDLFEMWTGDDVGGWATHVWIVRLMQQFLDFFDAFADAEFAGVADELEISSAASLLMLTRTSRRSRWHRTRPFAK